MSEGIKKIENFIGRAFESGNVNKIKCLKCGAESISLSLDCDEDLYCGECDSLDIEVETLN